MVLSDGDAREQDGKDALVHGLGGDLDTGLSGLDFLGDRGHVRDVLIFFGFYVSVVHGYLRGWGGVGQGGVRV
jgi:hypothetical protein